MSLPAAVNFGIPMIGFQMSAPLIEFMLFDIAQKMNPTFKRISGIIGGIPLYNVIRYSSTDAARPLFFRPSGEVFMSARDGGSTYTVRLEMFVTGKWALAYIQALRLLKRFGDGQFLSRLTMNASGIPIPLISSTSNTVDTRAGSLGRRFPLREFSYPFISKTDLFTHGKIEYLHIEREIEHGINFGYTVKLDIVKVLDPFIVGDKSKRSLVKGTLGVSMDEVMASTWALINSSGLLTGSDAKYSRYTHVGVAIGYAERAFSPAIGEKWFANPHFIEYYERDENGEIVYEKIGNVQRPKLTDGAKKQKKYPPIIKIDNTKIVSNYKRPPEYNYEYRDLGLEPPTYNRIYVYESLKPYISNPSTLHGNVNLSDVPAFMMEDPSGKYSGEYRNVLDITDEGILISDFPLRVNVTSAVDEDVSYSVDIMFYPLTPSPMESKEPKPRTISSRISVVVSYYITEDESAEEPKQILLFNEYITPGIIHRVRDSDRTKHFRFFIDNFSWPVQEDTDDISGVRVRMRMSCSIV